MTIKIVKLHEVAETSSGGTPDRGNKRFFEGTIPWIKSGELPDGEIISVEEKISEEGVTNSSAKLLKSGTLLIAMYGATVGKLGVLTFPATTNQAICAIHPCDDLNRDYLFYYLLSIRQKLVNASFGGAQPNISQDTLRNLSIPLPDLDEQRKRATLLKIQFSEIDKARQATEIQLKEVSNLANAIIYDTLNYGQRTSLSLGDALVEVKNGIGVSWKDYPVYGATRQGIALAKEPPGKAPQRYKPIIPGRVFYNPMRILIGSIAFAEDDIESGITSPDYVVLDGKTGIVNSRWFYYWLRSPLGQQCINSLARGAVRERMLFNRLAEGSIDLPDFRVQERASEALANLKKMQSHFNLQLQELTKLPSKILDYAFTEIQNG